MEEQKKVTEVTGSTTAKDFSEKLKWGMTLLADVMSSIIYV